MGKGGSVAMYNLLLLNAIIWKKQGDDLITVPLRPNTMGYHMAVALASALGAPPPRRIGEIGGKVIYKITYPSPSPSPSF